MKINISLCCIWLILFLNSENIFSQNNSAVISNNKFAIDLFDNLEKNKNIFFSPLSISTALAITINGTQGITLQSMRTTLKIENDLNLYNADIKNLITLLNRNRREDSIQLSLANSLWMQKDYKFDKVFIKTSTDYFNPELNSTIFNVTDELEKSRLKINNWVEEKTNDKIKNLIKPNALDTTTRLIITNAIYFKGRWLNQFDKTYTKDEPFYSIDKKINADYMRLYEAHFNYYEKNEFKILELPYLGKDFSMLIILPNEKDGINELQKNFSFENYNDWGKNLKEEIVDVSIPKFKLESEFKLSEILSLMGMKIAFSDDADFSGMIDNTNEIVKKKLKINDVIHKAFIDINEAGTEASAATAVIMMEPTELKTPAENKKIFKADHPFIFLIKENSTNTVLFLGRVMDPKSE